MKKKFILILIIALSFTTLTACQSDSKIDEYPKKPITWIVPFGTGGGSDQFARIMEKQIEKNSEAEIVVVNIPGAKTAVGLNQFMDKDSDGYTVLGATSDTIINMATGTSEQTVSDIIPVARIQYNIDMLFINNEESRFSNYEEMIDYLKENPEGLSVGTTGLDGADAFTIKKIEEHEDVKFKIMPFSEPGERYAALAGGHIDLLFEQPGDIISFLDANKYKPILSMSDERIEGFEEIPTTAEYGMDITKGYWRGIWVKKGTSQEHIDYITNLIIEAVESEDYKKYEESKFLHLREGLLYGEDFKKFIEDEYQYYKNINDN